MKHTIAYLACPYHHVNPAVKRMRLEIVNQTAAKMHTQGRYAYSPLTHNQPLSALGVSGTWDTWCHFDLEMLSRCDKLVVLTLPGWEESRGVQAEITHAKELGIPVEFLECSATEELLQLMTTPS